MFMFVFLILALVLYLYDLRYLKKGKGYENKEIAYLAGNFTIESTPELYMIKKPVYSENLLVTKMFME